MAGSCFHCGQKITDEDVFFDEHHFCCHGCKTVYEILNINHLHNFYNLNKNAGIKPDAKANRHFQFLDSPKIQDKVIDFLDDGITLVTFHIPVIHCTSCVWLLESLHTINPAIIQSTVNFTQKKVQISFKNNDLKLSEVAQLITQLGYKPAISLLSVEKKEPLKNRALLYKLVVAGFAFGNIMILAFPEYINPEEEWLSANKNFFRWGMFLLSLPVIFYAATDYFKSAWQGLKNKYINVDVPIALGILVLFLRSLYDILIDFSPGYFDSLAGLVFFMLIGKWFQQQTYKSMSFDRDYKSFYPIAVAKLVNGVEEATLLSDLKLGDRILIRNEEILPADAILMKGNAMIDNSFVTGESRLITKNIGEKIYAGGKQSGEAIELEIIKDVNQSYLTQLWNNDAFSKEDSKLNALTNSISQQFTLVILVIAFLAGLFWLWYDSGKVLQVVTSVLIIACPCALALSSPFILGSMMRIFGEKKFYIKNTATIESLAKIDTIVFDKTGTITENDSTQIHYEGKKLTDQNLASIKSILKNSNHPLSRALFSFISFDDLCEVNNYKEFIGKGQSALVNSVNIKIGSAEFVGLENKFQQNKTLVYVSIDEVVMGKFIFKNKYRKGLKSLIKQLNSYKLWLISGDNDSEKESLQTYFPNSVNMKFNQKPQEKLSHIKELQQNKQKILMVGDGLNDSGAIKQSNVGIAVSEDLNNFSPSCDAILAANRFKDLSKFLKLSKLAMKLVWIAFIISFLYNIVGLSFAITGNLRPVVAAILMPISSISVVFFALVSTRIAGKLHF